MKTEKGFTLIELTVAIVILAILAAFAIPKFIDLRLDARLAQLDGMKGALSSGTDLINYKAVIEKQTSGTGSIKQGDVNIALESGYPTGHWKNSMRYIVELDSIDYARTRETICEVEWCGKGNQRDLNSGISVTKPTIIGKVYPEGFSFNDQCGIYYINHRDGNKPEIVIENNDC